jgi:hypothetical protein
MLVTGCGLVTDNAEADPNNNIPETNELNNTGTAATNVACDTALESHTDPLGADASFDTSGGPAIADFHYIITDVLGTRIAPTTLNDTFPAGFVIQAPITTTGATTNTCTGVGTNVLSCPNLSGTDPIQVFVPVQITTAVPTGNYTNNASITTPGDTNLANNTDSQLMTVYAFDVVVNVVDNQDPVTFGQYIYTVTVTNNSAGGFNTGGFFITGGLQMRNADTSRNGARDGVTAFAAINFPASSSSAQCVLVQATGLGGANQRYACAIGAGGLAAGDTVTLTIVVDNIASEPDGFPEVALDAEVTQTQPSPCGGGGSNPNCAPETAGFARNFDPPASMTANNRDTEFTDID